MRLGSPSYRDFTFADSVMFAHVMENPTICKEFLELVLDVNIDHIAYSEIEKTLISNPFAKQVSLDAFVKGTNEVFDIEMQTSHFEDIGRRLRYYQSSLDATVMRRGMPYRMLPKSFIIFLCTDDPFNKDLPQYTLHPRCKEDPNVEIGAMQTWLVFNAKAWRDCKNKEISSLLEYIEDGTISDIPLIRKIDSEVQNANNDPLWKESAMGLITLEESMEFSKGCYYQDGLLKGREEGIVKGESRNKALTERLLADGRIDDLKRSLTDEAFCDDLYREYDL